MKTTIKLKGYIKDSNKEATPQKPANLWIGDSLEVVKKDSQVLLKTSKRVYFLDKHQKLNYYGGECNGHKVHITLKPMTGIVHFWTSKKTKQKVKDAKPTIKKSEPNKVVTLKKGKVQILFETWTNLGNITIKDGKSIETRHFLQVAVLQQLFTEYVNKGFAIA